MNKTLFLFTAALLALPLSCSKKAPDVKVESVTVVPASLSLVEGTSQQVRATVLPANATDPTVTWISSNTQVATVNAGTVTAVKPGSATITATAGVQKGTCAVTVTARIINVSAVTLNKSKTTIIIGGSETLTATVSPADASDKSVSWSSSAPAVATVDQSGKVTAVSVGSATITVTTVSGGKTATCVVTVQTGGGTEDYGSGGSYGEGNF